MIPRNFHLLSSIFILHAAGICSSSGSGLMQTAVDPARVARTGWTQEEDSWNYWWSYSGVSGPAYWGLLNPDWFMCDRGRRQSPIDVATRALIYDPNLKPLRADGNLISGILYNDGHSIVLNASLAAAARFSALERRKPQAAVVSAASDSPGGRATGDTRNGAATSADGGVNKSRRAAPSDYREQDQRDNSALASDANDFMLGGGRGGGGAGDAPLALLADPPARALFVRQLSGGGGGRDGASSVEQLASGGAADANLAGTAGERAASGVDGGEAEQPLEDEDAGADQLTPGGRPASRLHFSGGASAYSFRFEALQLKFGASAASAGSEHKIDGRAHAAELQVFAYNWQLYASFEVAASRPHGLLAISALVMDANRAESPRADQPAHEPPLERLASLAAAAAGHRGHYAPVRDLNLTALLPDTEQFVAYEGSLTQPGCHESVTWLILNRPLYISKQSLDKLRSISADEQLAQEPTGTLIAGNARPVQPINNRPIRTNIRPPSSGNSDKVRRDRTDGGTL